MGTTNGDQPDINLLDRLVDINLSEAQIKEVLEGRAASLASTEDEARDESTTSQYVTFRLEQERYALEVCLVEEIQPVKKMTSIPCTPGFILGAVNIRGRILPVVDIKSFFGLSPSELKPSSKIMVVATGEIHVGVLADQVEEVLDIALDDIKAQIETLSGSSEEFIVGITEEAVIILNLAGLAQDKRMIIHEDV